MAQELVSRQERFDDCHAGLQLFLVGLAKKMLLANPLGKVATELFGMGGDALSPLLAWLGARGVDRVVPMGRALDFDTIWDGRDLIACLSRVIG